MCPNKTSHRELTSEQQRIIALEKENKELKMANEILKKRMCPSSTIQVDKVPLCEKPVIILRNEFNLLVI